MPSQRVRSGAPTVDKIRPPIRIVLADDAYLAVLPEISEFGGEVIQTSVDDDAEAKLREVLEGVGVGQAA